MLVGAELRDAVSAFCVVNERAGACCRHLKLAPGEQAHGSHRLFFIKLRLQLNPQSQHIARRVRECKQRETKPAGGAVQNGQVCLALSAVHL